MNGTSTILKNIEGSDPVDEETQPDLHASKHMIGPRITQKNVRSKPEIYSG